MDSISTYNFSHFQMITLEVLIDLVDRFNDFIWPWQFVIICLTLFAIYQYKKRSKILWGVISLFWLFIAIFYHHSFFSEVHIIGDYFAFAFVLQALLLIVFKVLKTSVGHKNSKNFRILFFIMAFTPWSYFYPKTNGEILLFGWGADQTAIATVLILLSERMKTYEFTMLIVPILWLLFSFLFV